MDFKLMQAGKLNQQINIQEATVSASSYGQGVISYISYLDNIWARVEPLNGREYFQMKQANALIDTRFTIRYTTNVLKENMRIIHNSQNYNIVSIINPEMANREYILMCNRITT